MRPLNRKPSVSIVATCNECGWQGDTEEDDCNFCPKCDYDQLTQEKSKSDLKRLDDWEAAIDSKIDEARDMQMEMKAGIKP